MKAQLLDLGHRTVVFEGTHGSAICATLAEMRVEGTFRDRLISFRGLSRVRVLVDDLPRVAHHCRRQGHFRAFKRYMWIYRQHA